jgi:IS5 family transposase
VTLARRAWERHRSHPQDGSGCILLSCSKAWRGQPHGPAVTFSLEKIETNVHHPTDSRPLGDGVRVVSRLLRRAREALGEEATRLLGKEAFRTRNRSVRRLTNKLHRIALRKGEKAAEELKEAYSKLVRITRASLAQAGRVTGALRERAEARSHRLVDKLEHFVPLVEQGIEQALRRVLREEQVPAAEKVLSLFEEHTMIITRRKVGKPREYGRKVLLDEVDGGIISRYEVLSEAGREHPRTCPRA